MRSREEAARFIEHQLGYESDYRCQRNKVNRHHYGWQELRELMDFIYWGEPQCDAENLVSSEEFKKDA